MTTLLNPESTMVLISDYKNNLYEVKAITDFRRKDFYIVDEQRWVSKNEIIADEL